MENHTHQTEPNAAEIIAEVDRNREQERAPRWIDTGALLHKLSISRATLTRFMKEDPTFPKPIKLSQTQVRWCNKELEAWIEGKEAAR